MVTAVCGWCATSAGLWWLFTGDTEAMRGFITTGFAYVTCIALDLIDALKKGRE